MKTEDFKQLAAMRAGVDYRFKIKCRQFEVTVRPLANLEIIQAASEAADAFEKMPKNQQLSVTASLLNAMYQLEKASAKDVGEIGELTLPLMKLMTADEVNNLWKQYVRVCDKVNPDFEGMPAQELEALVEGLKKNSDPLSTLTDLSISNLIAVCQHLLRAQPE